MKYPKNGATGGSGRLNKIPSFHHTSMTSTLLIGFLLGCLFSTFHFNSNKNLIYRNEKILFNKYIKSEFYQKNNFALGSNPFDVEVTTKRILEAFPYNNNNDSPINKNIIQLWKERPEDSDDFPNYPEYKKWKEINPEFNHLFYSDSELFMKVQKSFEFTVPEVWEAFQLLPKIILKSDMGRYILVFLEGGLYTDIDTDVLKPISQWFDNFNYNIGMMVGMEEDFNRDDWDTLMPRRVQFLQWTFKARRHHPILAELIATIVKITFEAKYKDRLRAYYQDYAEKTDRCSSIDVIEWTGPAVFTDVIYKYMNSLINPNIIDIDDERTNGPLLYGPETNETINWKLFTGIVAPVIVEDVAVLPRTSFRYEDFLGDPCGKYCYLTHIFSSTWKNG